VSKAGWKRWFTCCRLDGPDLSYTDLDRSINLPIPNLQGDARDEISKPLTPGEIFLMQSCPSVRRHAAAAVSVPVVDHLIRSSAN